MLLLSGIQSDPSHFIKFFIIICLCTLFSPKQKNLFLSFSRFLALSNLCQIEQIIMLQVVPELIFYFYKHIHIVVSR